MTGRRDVRNLVRADIRAARGYTPGAQDPGRIKLNTNECAWPPSPAVREVLHAVADDRLRLYPDPMASELCRTAAARYGVDPAGVLAGNGSDDCLTVLVRSHLMPGQRACCPWPTYGLYDVLATLQGIELHRVAFEDTGRGGSWRLPADLAEADAEMLFLANPNNPSGTLVAPDAIAELAAAFPGILVVDEAYVDFAPAGSSFIPRLADHPNVVVLRTFSKSYSLAGARLGLLFADPALVAEYRKVKDSYNVSALAQAVGLAALGDTDHHTELVARTLAGRADLEDLCRGRGWTWAPSAANFLLADVGPAAHDIQVHLAERGLLVRWWDTPELRERLRISVGRPEHHALLREALAEVPA